MPRNPPQWPENPTFQQWGKDLLKWGVGSAGAEERMKKVTRDELFQNKVITIDLLEITRDFYTGVYRENPRNKTALARKNLLQYMIDLLAKT